MLPGVVPFSPAPGYLPTLGLGDKGAPRISLLNKVSYAEVCDATVDAMKCLCRLPKKAKKIPGVTGTKTDCLEKVGKGVGNGGSGDTCCNNEYVYCGDLM